MKRQENDSFIFSKQMERAEDPWQNPEQERKRHLLKLTKWGFIICGVISVLLAAIVMSSGRNVDEAYDDPEALAGPSNYVSKLTTNFHKGSRWWGKTGSMSGVWRVFSFTVERDAWGELSYTLEVTRGKAKLILVDPDGNVTTIRECLAGESAQETVKLSLPAGTNWVKLVGAEEAAYSWDLEMKDEAEENNHHIQNKIPLSKRRLSGIEGRRFVVPWRQRGTAP